MENVDPNSVAALVARLGADTQVVDLRDGGEAVPGAGPVVVVATHAASGAQRLRALAGAAVSGMLLEDLVARLHAAGLAVRAVHGTLEDPVAGAGDAVRRVPPEVVEWVRAQPGALVRELVVLAEPGPPVEVPALVPAVDESAVRLADAYTDRAERDLRERREVLTVRDHVLGLEVTATAADEKATQRGRKIRELRELLEERDAEIVRLREQLGESAAAPEPSGLGRLKRR
jgi:hypothetical protein